MIFIIDEEIYNKTHYCLYDPLNDIRFYFDYANYNLWDVADIENVEGMIPFVRIREVDVMKEFIVSLNDRKLLSKFTPLSDKELWHTFCTRLCENESNLKVIQSVMGHSDIQTTMDIYAECTAEKKQEVFATLNGKIMIK